MNFGWGLIILFFLLCGLVEGLVLDFLVLALLSFVALVVKLL